MSKAVTFWLSDEAIEMLKDIMNRTKLKKSFIVEQGIKKMNKVLKSEIFLDDPSKGAQLIRAARLLFLQRKTCICRGVRHMQVMVSQLQTKSN